MTSKELQNKLYSVECSLDMVDSDISTLVEQLNYEKREMARAYEETKGDKFVSHYLRKVFREHRSDTEEKTRLCSRLAKGGLENNESK